MPECKGVSHNSTAYAGFLREQSVEFLRAASLSYGGQAWIDPYNAGASPPRSSRCQEIFVRNAHVRPVLESLQNTSDQYMLFLSSSNQLNSATLHLHVQYHL